MKKFVSLLTVMCLVFMATISIQAQETSEPKRITSGQKVYGSPSYGEWEEYEIVVSEELVENLISAANYLNFKTCVFNCILSF